MYLIDEMRYNEVVLSMGDSHIETNQTDAVKKDNDDTKCQEHDAVKLVGAKYSQGIQFNRF